MTKLIKRVGVVETTLQLIPEIVQTCSVCREWNKPGPTHASCIDLPDYFNQKVEIDLLFMYTRSILSILDRCTRWHVAAEVEDKRDITLITAFDTAWTAIHGPPKEVIVDGESGIVSSQMSL